MVNHKHINKKIRKQWSSDIHCKKCYHFPLPSRDVTQISNRFYSVISLFNVSSLGRYVFGSEISYNKAPPRLPGLGC
jgi:hypothetical protein